MRRFIEFVWLALAAICLVEGVISWQAYGFEHDNTIIFLMVFLASVFMYFFRRYQRTKRENTP
jgi:tryptophan-rich sensory protein